MNKQLLELLQKHPEAKIYPFTKYEVVGGDMGWWLGDIESIYYGSFWEYDEWYYLDWNDVKENEEIVMSKLKEYKGIIILIDV